MNINLTRQQLAILGSLLLVGYLVFCCFGYVLGSGTASSEAPAQGPAVASAPQDTIKPTDTPVPTNTPIPLPTVTPVPTDTLIPAPAGPPLEVQLYALEIAEKTITMGEALGDLGELLQYPRLGDDDWIVAVATQMVIIQLTHEELVEMDVPPEMTEIHNLLLDATNDCSTSMDYLSSGIDNLNVTDLETANTLMTSCGEKVEKPTKMIEEYMAQFE